MKIENYAAVVELLQGNALFDCVTSGEYYTDDTVERTVEAQNICLEFVLEMPGVREILAAEFAESGDDQILIEWLKDAVLTV